MIQWDATTPIYRQVRDRLVAEILEGRLQETDAAPSVRQFAAEASINPLTVSRAYQELVDAGVLEKRRGLGMFVAPGARQRLLNDERARFMAEEWPALRARLERLGLSHLLATKDVSHDPR